MRITSNKSALKEINVYSEIVRIQGYGITDYPDLENITFAEHTRLTLDKFCIINVPKLEKLKLPAKTKFTEGAISFCGNLEQITFQKDSRYIVNSKTGSVISPSGTLLFVPSDTESYTTMEGIKKIGDFAFTSCKNLSQVISNAKIIGEYAFMSCKKLKSLTLLNNTKKIENFAFTDCNLSSFHLPKSVKSIGHGILHNNNNLKTIKTEGRHYKSENGVLTSFSGKTLLAIIPQKGKAIVPNGVITSRTTPVTAPSKVITLSFPTSLRKFYQMGQGMKNLQTIVFQSQQVPEALEMYMEFRDNTILQYIGYDIFNHIDIPTTQKVIVDVPDNQKKAYYKFIKRYMAYWYFDKDSII